MTYNEILDELRAKLGDSAEENNKILREEAVRYAEEGNLDGVKATGELMLENMTPEQKAEVERLTHVDGVRLDELNNRINKMLNEKKVLEAKPLAERLYKKIIVDFKETERKSMYRSEIPSRTTSVSSTINTTRPLHVLPSISLHISQRMRTFLLRQVLRLTQFPCLKRRLTTIPWTAVRDLSLPRFSSFSETVRDSLR